MTIQQSIDACKRCDDGGDGDGDARVVVGGKRDRCKSWRMEERLEVDGQGSCTARGIGAKLRQAMLRRFLICCMHVYGEPLAGAKGVMSEHHTFACQPVRAVWR